MEMMLAAPNRLMTTTCAVFLRLLVDTKACEQPSVLLEQFRPLAQQFLRESTRRRDWNPCALDT
jgi:hypothetical protein